MIHGLCGIIPGWIGWSIKLVSCRSPQLIPCYTSSWQTDVHLLGLAQGTFKCVYIYIFCFFHSVEIRRHNGGFLIVKKTSSLNLSLHPPGTLENHRSWQISEWPSQAPPLKAPAAVDSCHLPRCLGGQRIWQCTDWRQTIGSQKGDGFPTKWYITETWLEHQIDHGFNVGQWFNQKNGENPPK